MNDLPEWLASWKRQGMDWHRTSTSLLESLNADVAAKLVSRDFRRACGSTSGILKNLDGNQSAGIAEHSIMAQLIEDEVQHGLSSKESAWLAGSLSFVTLLYYPRLC